MTQKDLLHHCRYYKGEKECPHDGTKGMLWRYEKSWIELALSKDDEHSDLLSKILTEYLLAGLKDFEKFDDTPVTLKALLYNRFEQWNEGGDFKDFYHKYY